MLDVNEYFDGKVKSIAFQTATLPATVGVMQAGEYEFNTEKKRNRIRCFRRTHGKITQQ